MNYKDLKIDKVAIPNLAIPEKAKMERKNNCPICKSPYRKAIEALYFSGLTQAKQVEQARVYGVRTTFPTIQKHIEQHYVPAPVEQTIFANDEWKVIETTPFEEIGAILAQYENPISIEALAHVILSRGLSDIANGSLKATSIKDLLTVISVVNNQRKLDFEMEQAVGAARQDIEDAYRQLGAIMRAVKRVLADQPEVLEQLVTAAWSEGLDKDIADISEVPAYIEQHNATNALPEDDFGV